ncbi:MAG TPA: PIG-L family deacetylase [Caulobacteraceae bacterium]
MVTALGGDVRAAFRERAEALDVLRLQTLFPALVLVPHPDDETLGCGGLIATAASLGLELKLAFLTDGGGSHLGSATWPRDRLVRVRQQEAVTAANRLGVGRDDIIFLNWPDGNPFPDGTPEFDHTVTGLQTWLAGSETRSIWATWAQEPHADHRAAAAVADALAARLSPMPERLSYLVWGWQSPELVRARSVLRLSCSATVDQRRQALRCHRTQMSDLVDAAAEGFRIPVELAALTEEPVEYYLPCR